MAHITTRTLLVCMLYAFLHVSASAQTTAPPANVTAATNTAAAGTSTVSAVNNPTGDASATDDVRRQLREQREEIERLQTMLKQQMRLIDDLRTRVERTEQASAPATVSVEQVVLNDAPPADGKVATTPTPELSNQSLPIQAEERIGNLEAKSNKVEEYVCIVEAQAKKTRSALAKLDSTAAFSRLGSIEFSGNIRFRYESIYGQLNGGANSNDPSVLGNPLSSRQRFRLRAQLALSGRVNKKFDWGLRLSTGTFPDVISPNQTLTDFYSHKNFALDQAFIGYRPHDDLRLQAGKFRPPWVFTEMTFDNDVQVEGLSQTYKHDFKKSVLANVTFHAWQLPFLERASAFVLGADGRVNVEQSKRAGRDLALYGAQLLTQFEPGKKARLTVSAADLYFSGTQFITPLQFFGSNIQLPVTITIPATATTPAQTVTGQATILREQLVAGGSLGISTGTNNAVNRDGRLSSGFNLVDLIGRLELSHSERFPVMLLFNFTTNTQTHDIVVAGAGGSNLLLPNNENNAYWAEIQVGKTEARGDWQLGYTFMRIEKDAVLTPFNMSDIAQQSDIRAQRFNIAYAADPRVTLMLTGIVTHRANGLAGVFGATPPGSLNTPTTRLQFDTQFRF